MRAVSRRSRFTRPVAQRIPSAVGRSNAAPSFRRSAGARLMVMRSRGNSKPAFLMAARTRSRLSRTAESGRPTVVNEGRPFVTSTSTETVVTSTPWSAAERTFASMNRVCEGGRSASMTQDGYSRSAARGGAGLRISGSLLEAEHGGAILLNAVTPTPVLPAGVLRRLDATGRAPAQGERDSHHCHDRNPDRVGRFALTPHWPLRRLTPFMPWTESRETAQNRCMRRPDGGTRSVQGNHDRSKRRAKTKDHAGCAVAGVKPGATGQTCQVEVEMPYSGSARDETGAATGSAVASESRGGPGARRSPSP